MSNLPTTTEQNNALAELVRESGSGLENVTASDMLIPRLTIIQGLSPQVIKGKPEYDPDCRVGDIYDTGLQERFPDGIEIITCHYEKKWLRWGQPRATGKLVAIYDGHDMSEMGIENELKPNDQGQPQFPNGDVLTETAQFYAINLTAPERRNSFIPMSITQLKKAKHLLTMASAERVTLPDGKQVVPPLYWRSYFVTTVPESNAKGNWMGWKIRKGPRLDEREDWKELLVQIKDFRKAVAEGRATGDMGGAQEEGGGGRPSDDGEM